LQPSRTLLALMVSCVSQKIVFVEQFFYPEGWGGAELPRTLTMHLSRSGFEVEVICGSDQYAAIEGESDADPRTAGVKIRRIPSLFSGDIRRLKIVRQLWFYIALIPLLLLRRRPALFILQTNPPLAIVLAAFAARVFRTPLVIIAMDLYPEVLVAHKSLKQRGIVTLVLFRIFRFAYRSAARIVSLGPVMSERLVSKGIDPQKIVEICNWSTGAPGVIRGSANRLLDEWNLRGYFVIAYSGNLGVAHEFETFLRGFAAACKDFADLRLAITGKGTRLAESLSLVQNLDLSTRVHHSNFVPAARLPESIGVADVALVTLQLGFEGLVVPSKLYGLMSRSVPVLYVGPRSDVELEVKTTGCGLTVRNGDIEGVRSAIATLYRNRELLRRMGAAGFTAYQSTRTSDVALRRYLAVVQGLVEAS
jgi:colanic acid biosynthesis glycosyl transferase WcaI